MGTTGRGEDESKTNRTVRPSHRFILVFVAGLIFWAVASFGVSCLSFGVVSRAVLGSNSGAADTLVHNFAAIIFRLRVSSAGFLLAALLAALYRRRLQTWIEEAIWPMPRFLGDATRSVVGAWRADGKLVAWVVAALTVLGTILRVRFLFGPVGFDEADTFVSYASRPLYLGLSWYRAPNNHLLYTFLMHITWRLFGDHEWVLRLPALLAGILLIPVTYWTGRVLYDKHSALIAAALVTAASPIIFYSVNGRGYTLVCVFFLLLLILGRYLLDHDSSPGWLLWGLVAAVGLYTIPIMLYAAGTVTLWLALSGRNMETERRGRLFAGLGSAIAVTGFVTILLYLPVLVVSGPKSLFANPWVHPLTFERMLNLFPAGIKEAWGMLTADVPRLLVGGLVAGFMIGLIFHERVAAARVPVPIAALLCIAPLVLAQRVIPYGRVWLFLVPLSAIVSSAGLWFLVRLLANRFGTYRLSGIASVIAVGCSLIMGSALLQGRSVSSRGGFPGIQSAAVWMKGQLMPRDILLGKLAVTAHLTYYLRQNGIHPVYRAAPCDSMSLVYSFNAPYSGVPATGETRVLAVVLDRSQTVESVLSIMCLPIQAFSAPKLVYSDQGVSVYESYIDHRAFPSMGNGGA